MAGTASTNTAQVSVSDRAAVGNQPDNTPATGGTQAGGGGGGGTPSGPAGGDLAGTYPNPSLKAIGSAAGPVGDSTHVAAVTIDAKGRVTALSSVAIATGSGTVTSVAGGTGLTASPAPITGSGTLSLNKATTSALGGVIVPSAGNLAVDGSGNLSVPTASTTVLGVVKVDGSSIVISGSGVISAPTGGSGTVTSVDMTVPAEFAVSGNPITGAGTLAVTKATQAANKVWSGPTSGSAAQPAFRSLVAADLPNTAVTPATYGDSTHVGQFTVDAQGRITAASAVSISVAGAREVYLSDYASLALADAAAVAANGSLVINQDTTISSSITVASPVRVTSGRFKIATSQVLTLSGGVDAPLTAIFIVSSGTIGTVKLNASTKLAWPEWWGAAGGNSANDDAPGINAAIQACGATSSSTTFGNCTLSFANKTYYLKSTVTVDRPVPIVSMPGAGLAPAATGGATVGMICGLSGTLNWEAVVFLPRFDSFSSIGLQLWNCNLATINIGMIVGCGDGIELLSDQAGACLDNNINVQGIYSCTDAAIKVKTVGNVAPGLATLQGNVVYANFINGCLRWVYFVQSGGGAGANNDNRFKTDAVDFDTINGCTAIDNSAGFTNSSNVFEMFGFFAGYGSSGLIGNGQFEQCQFIWSGVPQMTDYTSLGLTETSTTGSSFGNRYDLGGLLSQNLSSYAAQTSAGSRASYNGGVIVPFNRIKVTMAVSGLAAGASTNFYIYSPFVLGNARLGFVPVNMAGCVCTACADNTSAHANEILITVTNVTASPVTATLGAQVTVGL